MRGLESVESHGRLSGRVDAPDIAEHLLALLRARERDRHRVVEFGKSLHELIDADVLQRLRHQSRHLDIRHFQPQAHFTA